MPEGFFMCCEILSGVKPEIMRLYIIASKINVVPEDAYLPLSKLHSILVIANLIAHNNKS